MITDPSTHLFWITSRAAGTTALIFSSASVGYGLMMGGKLIKGSNADRRVLHEVLALCTMLAIAVHGLALLGDGYLHPTFLDITLPFAMSYQQLYSTVGIIAGWGLILLGLSFYFRNRIGMARWKIIHRFTLLAWLGGLVHSLGEGTDAGTAWFLALLAITTIPVVVLFLMRVGRRSPRPAMSPVRS
ncbi:MAG TPA: ferric reductase-like transmembrane domain-containing protein [Solirubrobacteraceae bacterium]|jgi:sulfoxide reductase heme-binding subunit YedZ|nr:ferric reductase-like transmembrane domain-containing protein [Solirubrobacteraceae bacterium]